MSRRTLAVAAAALATAVAPAAAQAPDRIPLPDGWQPEGIASGPGNSLYVGSIANRGVLKLNPRTGRTKTVVDGGHAAIGLKVRGNKLFVAGGETGRAYVYRRRDGKELISAAFGKEGNTFVNDVTLAGKTAYFTDSRRSVIYALTGAQTETIEVPDVPASGDFNLNGIVATPGGTYLLAVHSGDGDLYRIDPDTGNALVVDLGEASLENGDGMLLQGRRLAVVQNRSNVISTFKLAKDFTSGTKTGELTNDAFDVPTTIAAKGKRLYAVNARFGTDPKPDTAYWVTRVR